MSNVYAFAVVLLIDTLQWLGVIPDPIKVLEAALEGRPKQDATVQTIDFLQHHRNPAGRLWGVMLSRLLTDEGIVISSSDAGSQKSLGLARSQFIKSAILQGLTNDRAQTIADILMSPAAQNQPIKIDFLTTAAPDGFVFNGAGGIASMYSEYLQAHPITGGGPNTLGPEQAAEQYVYKHAKIADLLNSWIGPQLPDFYTPTGVITPGQNPCGSSYSYDPTANVCYLTHKLPISPLTQGCAAGYQYNPATFLCDWIPTGQQTGTGNGNGNGDGNAGGNGGGQTGTIPLPPTPTAGGDELTDCCNSTATYLYYVAVGIQNLISNAQGGPNAGQTAAAQCCANIVAALQQMAAVIQGLPTALSLAFAPNVTPTVDLAGVLNILTTINQTLETANANSYGGAAEITSALSNIATAISNGKLPDLSQIIAALQTIAAEGDVSDTAFAYLEAQGYITGGDTQFYVGMPWATAFFVMIRKFAHDVAKGFIGEVTGYDIDTGLWNYTGVPRMQATLRTIAEAWLLTQDSIIQPLLDPVVDGIIAFLQPTGANSYTKVGVDPGKAPAAALGTALSITIGMTLFSYLGIDIGEGATRIAELVAAGVGYEQLRDVIIGPIVKHGIAKQADFTARALFRQEGPGYGELVRLAARGYIGTDRPPQLAPALGIPAEFVPVLQNAAYTSMPERLLIQLLESPLFSSADLTRVLTEHGLNPRDQALLQTIMPYLATRAQRSALIATLERMYELGLSSAVDLSNGIESAEANTDFESLISTNANLKKAIAMTLALEKSYTEMAKAGVMIDTLYTSNLESIGFQPDMAATLTAVVDNHLATVAFRQAAAAERALVKATTAAERKAALANFNAGTLDAAGYAAALLLTGLSATQAAAWVDLAVARKAGSTRWIYGLQLAPQAATLLRERVTGLSDQRKEGLLSDANYIAALQALGLSDNWINALRATADASGPAANLEFVPVRTS